MKHLIVVLAVVLSYSVAAMGQEGSKRPTLPLFAGLPDTLSVETLAKVRSVMVMPDGTRTLLDSVSNVLFVDRRFPTDPMPNAYLGDSCVAMPNAYAGDNSVPMPNAYQAPSRMSVFPRDSVTRSPRKSMPR